MNYQFPVIRNISDVLPAIEGRSEFVVAVKDGYTVINYNVMFEDTFPPVNVMVPGPFLDTMFQDGDAAIRRECRGIIFDNETGDILRRPYHKFFNVNERPETENIPLYDDHIILDKLDGSMIAPFFNRGVLVFGTKMGATDVAKPVEEFVNNNPQYIDFSRDLIENGFTPIFEWCSRKQRIVLDYPEDRLILTALRHIETGIYANYGQLLAWSKFIAGIPVVKALHGQSSIEALIYFTKGLQDTEGFVVRFDDGHMVKLKCDWYVQIHKAKERILQDRHIVELILDQRLDDVKAHLPQEERDRLSQFENDFNKVIHPLALSIVSQVSNCRRIGGMDRKTFATTYANKMSGLNRSIAFAMWDEVLYVDAVSVCEQKIYNTIRKNLAKTSKYEEIRAAWFPGVVYNA